MSPTILRLCSLFALLALVLTAERAEAESSNRNEVRQNLEKGGWRVIWGKNFTEDDWGEGFKAIAQSVAEENPGPFIRWFGQVLDDNFKKIEMNLSGVTREDAKRLIVQSLKQKKVAAFKGLEIEAGFATYDRWQKLPANNKLNLPNWHQFYIRYKVNGASPPADKIGRRFALDANGGKGGPYMNSNLAMNDNHLFQLEQVGEHVRIIPKAARVAIDVNGGVGGPYFNSNLSPNDNHLFRLEKAGEHFMIVAKVKRVALDADGCRGALYWNDDPDPKNKNHLWDIQDVGPFKRIVSAVAVRD